MRPTLVCRRPLPHYDRVVAARPDPTRLQINRPASGRVGRVLVLIPADPSSTDSAASRRGRVCRYRVRRCRRRCCCVVWNKPKTTATLLDRGRRPAAELVDFGLE